jgi:membrane-anchored protein YejM (alkaline phosphatase superfamily)
VCPLRGIKGNLTPRYFGPSVFLSFVNQLPTKIETSFIPIVTLTCFMLVSSKYVCETLLSLVDYEILDLVKIHLSRVSLIPLVQWKKILKEGNKAIHDDITDQPLQERRSLRACEDRRRLV